jgi:hypothetical protein
VNRLINESLFYDAALENFLYEEEPAMEAVERDKTTKILKTALYKKIVDNISIEKNKKELFKYIANFRNKYISILSNPLITKIIPFNHMGEDARVVYRCCGLTEDEINPAIEKAKIAVKLDAVGKNVTPFNVVMIMLISYFYDDKPRLKSLLLYYACGMYYLIYSGMFKKFGPDEECMQYTVDNLSNKFILKKEGSLEKAMVLSLQNGVDHYRTVLKNLSDYDICNTLIPGLRTRVASMLQSVAGEYFENYAKGNKIFTQKEYNEEGEFIIDRESDIARVNRAASAAAINFYSHPINLNIIRTVAKMHTDASENEIRACIEYIHDEPDSKSVQRFYESIFTAFFNDNPTFTTEDLYSMKFLAAANSIYKKGNSKDSNIVAIKSITHDWLSKGSPVYARSTRVATINTYRKCIFMYFVMAVSSK